MSLKAQKEKVIFAWASDTGKVRQTNEDYFGNYENDFFLVADGLGGHPAGEVASKLAVEEALKEYKTSRLLRDGEEILRRTFSAANKKVFEEAIKLNNLGMGTTLVAALVSENKVFIGNVGDSRAYLLHKKELRQVTADQEETVFGWLLQAVGLEKDLKQDFYQENFGKEDLLLLCTDGLTDQVSNERIFAILKNTGELKEGLEEKCQKLVKMANEVGGRDNVTAGLIKYA